MANGPNMSEGQKIFQIIYDYFWLRDQAPQIIIPANRR
jgi:hypothetical protein